MADLLIDVRYHRDGYSRERYLQEGYAEILTRDNVTDEFKYQVIHDPTVDIYFALERPKYNKYTEKLSKCRKQRVKYRDIRRLIAQEFHTQEPMKTKGVYNADFKCETLLRHKWLLDHEEATVSIRTGFIDIETDLIACDTRAAPTRDPINAITIISTNDKLCYTYILKRNTTDGLPEKVHDLVYHQIEEYKKIEDDKQSFINELHETFDSNYLGMQYEIFFYENERLMIHDCMQKLNDWNLDFVGIWNMDFDIPYIADRLIALNTSFAEECSDSKFEHKYFRYEADTTNFDIFKRSSACISATHHKFMCQMLNFANIRRGETKQPSYSLDHISDIILKDSKLKYSTEGNIRTIPYVNPKMFIIYNIKDVLLQYGIDLVTKDFLTMYTRALNSCTPYDNLNSTTQFVRNQKMKDYFNMGYVMCNKFKDNADLPSELTGDEDDEEYDVEEDSEKKEEKKKFAGAFVADPLLNMKVGTKVNGKETNFIYDYAIDEDLSSMYPSINSALNIDADTLEYKLDVTNGKETLKRCQLPDIEENEITTIWFDSILSKDYYSLLRNWFNAPDITSIILQLKERLRR